MDSRCEKLVTDYCGSFTSYMFHYENYFDNEISGEKQLQELEQSNRDMMELEKNYYLFKLNFSNNKDNEQIVKCIDDVRNYALSIDEKIKNQEELSNLVVRNLVLVSRDYFKREWNRSKQGK